VTSPYRFETPSKVTLAMEPPGPRVERSHPRDFRWTSGDEEVHRA
jgi:hypothetical protein